MITPSTVSRQGPPLGPVVDDTPRPLPARIPHHGQNVDLEPLHPRHAPDLFRAATNAEDSWAYLGYGPFRDEEAMRRARVGVGDLLEAARAQYGLKTLDDIDAAVLEVSGGISIIPKER